jgi:hypothetical protein
MQRYGELCGRAGRGADNVVSERILDPFRIQAK